MGPISNNDLDDGIDHNESFAVASTVNIRVLLAVLIQMLLDKTKAAMDFFQLCNQSWLIALVKS